MVVLWNGRWPNGYRNVNALKTIFDVIKLTAMRYTRDRGSMLAAALAYYTLFSLAPLLIISVALAEQFLSDTNVQLQLLTRIRLVAGPEVSEFVRNLIQGFGQNSTGLIASIASIAVSIYGASNVFRQGKRALNTVWGVRVEDHQGIVHFLKVNLLSFGLVLVIGLLLLIALAMNAMAGIAGGILSSLLNTSIQFSFLFEYAIPLGLTILLFALLYKILPDVEVSWRDVWPGALLTTLLTGVVLVILRLYLNLSSFGAAYGAAGSLVVLLFIVYNSAQIFIIGAEFTQVYTNRFGSHKETGQLKPNVEEVEEVEPTPLAPTSDKPIT